MDTDTEAEKKEGSPKDEMTPDSTGGATVAVDPPREPITIHEPLPVPAPLPEAPSPASSAVPIHRMPTLPQLAVALSTLWLIFAFSYLPVWLARQDTETEPSPEAPKATESVHTDDAFKEISITAAAAYVWDVKHQRALYNKNAGSQLPLASLTKLMTTLVAYERLKGEYQISITRQALLQEGDSALSSGETFTLRNLADLTLIASSNDGAYALAAAAGATFGGEGDPTNAFVGAMNAKGEEIGLSQSYFTNSTGLDVDGATSGSYGSARDMAFLMEYLVLKHPEILEATREASGMVYDEQGARIAVKNTNEIVARIPGLIGSKTGFTMLAGGNLAIAYDAGLNRPIVITVLGSSREGRFSDTLTLIEKTAEALTNESP